MDCKIAIQYVLPTSFLSPEHDVQRCYSVGGHGKLVMFGISAIDVKLHCLANVYRSARVESQLNPHRMHDAGQVLAQCWSIAAE